MKVLAASNPTSSTYALRSAFIPTKSNLINSKKPANCPFGQVQVIFEDEYDIRLEIIVVPVVFHWPFDGIHYVCRFPISNPDTNFNNHQTK